MSIVANTTKVALLSSAAMFLAVQTGLAQDDAADQEDDSQRGSAALIYEAVTVTAQKKGSAENLQDVPVAISAFSGAQVEAMHAVKLSDVGLMSPNVRLQNVGTLPGVANFTIRGMGFLASTAAVDPTVSVVVDGVTLGTTYGAQLDTFDIESIEMLRGPQGTLFGRNVTGGAVTIRSKRPSGDFGFNAKVGTGTANRKDISVAVDVPIFEDTLAGRITVMSKDRDSYFKNVNYPGTNVLTGLPFDNVSTGGDDIGAEQSFFARPILQWTPNGSTDITLIAEYGNVQTAGSTGKLREAVEQVDANGDTFRFPGIDQPIQLGNRELSHDTPGAGTTEWYQTTLEANFDIGPGTLTSITGIREVDVVSFADIDATPYTSTIYDITLQQEQFSQEVRYNADLFDDRLNLTVGGLYFTQETDSRERLVFGVAEIGGLDFTRGGLVDHSSYGIFTQGDFKLTDTLTFQGGLRYTSEEKEADLYLFNGCTLDLETCTPGLSDERSWNNLGGTAGLQWKPTEDVLVFGKYTRAFRSGGFNVRASNAIAGEPYDEETVDAYEIGIKADITDTFRLNASLFQNEFEGLQRVILDATRPGVQNIQNAADASISGVEVEANWAPLDNLVFTGAVGYLDAAYDDFPGFDVDGDGAPDPDQARALAFERAPEWTYSASANYDVNLDSGAIVTLRTSYSFTDERTVNVQNSRFHDSYGLVDASVSWTDPDDRFKVALFGKNLGDTEYAHTGAFFGGLYYEYIEAPRTWGLEASVNF